MNRKTTRKERDGCARPEPIELEECHKQASRGPQQRTGPPTNGTDITQIKKIRQCVFALLARYFAQLPENGGGAEETTPRTRLRPEEAVINSPRLRPPLLRFEGIRA